MCFGLPGNNRSGKKNRSRRGRTSNRLIRRRGGIIPGLVKTPQPGSRRAAQTGPIKAGLPALALALLVAGPRLAAEPRPETTREAGEPVPIRLPEPPRPRTLVDRVMEADEPGFGGWETEVLSAAAGGQLNRIGAWIHDEGQGGARALEPLVGPGFGCEALRPAELVEVFRDGLFTVRRGAGGGAGTPAQGHRGAEGLARTLTGLLRGLGDGGAPHVKFKVTGIDQGEDAFTTRVLFLADRHGATGAVQQNAEWTLRWRYPADADAPPLLSSIALLRYEEIALDRPGGVLFRDHTAAALGATPAYREQHLRGVAHWVDRISRLDGVSLFGHSGLALGDVNGDGLEDLYVCDEGGLPNRLYLQRPDGTLDDVTTVSGADWLDRSFSALLVDLDNDGDQDLAVATYRRLLLAENDGAGRFTLRTALRGVEEAFALSAADYDDDGDLDLYAATYGGRGPGAAGESARDDDDRPVTGLPVPYHDANNGGANALLRNDGEFRFADATKETGLDANNSRFSFAAAWEDYDDDGDLDLYVANDFGRNNLYRNDGGRFSDVAAEAGVEDIATGMSVSWGDYDRDGDLDVYVGNMYSSAGNRITYQRRFAPGQDAAAVAHLQRTARGNSLFRNSGDGTFEDVSESAGVTMGRWAWSSSFTDLNNDGWLDVVVANGFLTGEDPHDL